MDFVNAQDLKGLMLDLAQNSFIDMMTDSAILIVDLSKKTHIQKNVSLILLIFYVNTLVLTLMS